MTLANDEPRFTLGASAEDFNGRDQCISALAHHLIRGRLVLVLGSGISLNAGLPTWENLIQLMCRQLDIGAANSLSPEEQAEQIWLECNRDIGQFTDIVRSCLYGTLTDQDLLTFLLKSPLHAAILSIVSPSLRGNVATIITFNFDELIEAFLQANGLLVHQVASRPTWTKSADVVVNHPHGILPLSGNMSTTGVLLAQIHYDALVGRESDHWNQFLLAKLSSSFALFLGLSGRDSRLRSIISQVNQQHIAIDEGRPFWGLRVSDSREDPMKSMWKERGVIQLSLNTYAELPDFLLDICRAAARERRNWSE